MQIKGINALITGGCEGIGKAYVVALLKQEANKVCILDINPDGEDVANSLNEEFGREKVDFIKTDVSQYEELKDAFLTAWKKYGYLNLLVNNAGILGTGMNLEMNRAMCRINIEAVVYGMQLGMEYMSTDGEHCGKGGMIVNMSSVAANRPFSAAWVYCGTKAAVLQMTRAAGTQERVDNSGLRINCVCPEPVQTNIFKGAPELHSALSQMPALLTPEFVAEGFLKLVESERTGEAMEVNDEGFSYYEVPNQVIIGGKNV